MLRALLAEAIGTFALVAAICGSFIAAAGFPGFGSGMVGISLSVGLTVLAMTCTFRHISGGHFNPAISFGALIAGRFGPFAMLGYWLAQLAGGALAAAAFYAIFSTLPHFEAVAFASNGYGNHSPGEYPLLGAAIAEVMATAVFVLAVLGASRRRMPALAGPVTAGVALAAVHLWTLPITGTSVNPARSTATALFAEPWALHQLWLFWAAPLAGAAIAGALERFVFDDIED